MKRALLLFAKPSVDAGRADPVRLCELISDPTLQADWAYLDDLLYSLDDKSGAALYDSRNKCDIQAYSVVYFRVWAAQEGHAIAAARICNILKVPFIDTEPARTGTRNKLSQYVQLFEAGIALPKSLMGDPKVLQANYPNYGFSFPFVMKDKSGTRGEQNYLVHTDDEMSAVIKQHAGKSFILQEFIPNTGDFRLLIIGGKARLLIRRTAPGGSHLNNISQGGTAETLPLSSLPSEVIAMGEKAAAVFGREIAGVDLVQSEADGSYYCFEVNRAPQIENSSFEFDKAALLRDFLINF